MVIEWRTVDSLFWLLSIHRVSLNPPDLSHPDRFQMIMSPFDIVERVRRVGGGESRVRDTDIQNDDDGENKGGSESILLIISIRVHIFQKRRIL